jgi:hypothetical protein
MAIADSQERHIHVNGEHLDGETIQLLDGVFGEIVPDGYYLIDFNTGEWGIEGNSQVQGILQTQSAPDSGYGRGEINTTSTGSYVSGRLNGQDCSFVSVGGTTMKMCD